MQFLLGCLGIIIIISIIMAILGWMFNNVVGILGIGFAIWGIYEWNVNRKLGAKSKAPGIIVAIGVLVASAWFIGADSETVPTATSTTNSTPSTESAETKQSTVKNVKSSQSETATTPTTNATSPATSTTATTVASASPPVTPARVKAKVVETIDGDTIKVQLNGKEETVRFLLVDTPETKHPTYGEQPFGREASNFTKQLVSGKTVELEQDVNNGPDKYGRLLYYAYVDGKSVQEQLLEKGLARVAYIYAPNVKYVDQYRAIQEKAQKTGVGIWSVENYAQEDGYHPEVVKKNESTPTKVQAVVSKSKEKLQPAPASTPEPVQEVYYANCSEAKAAGAAPLYRGEPGYRAKLDRDNDGIACEK
ncbi:thermonuclease family protein [Brevibacillus agri]|uniref:thermonuclease family protein n=1 Tax=Brevibacillus agri TaxID=51101 RepID=UPI003D1D3341